MLHEGVVFVWWQDLVCSVVEIVALGGIRILFERPGANNVLAEHFIPVTVPLQLLIDPAGTRNAGPVLADRFAIHLVALVVLLSPENLLKVDHFLVVFLRRIYERLNTAFRVAKHAGGKNLDFFWCGIGSLEKWEPFRLSTQRALALTRVGKHSLFHRLSQAICWKNK